MRGGPLRCDRRIETLDGLVVSVTQSLAPPPPLRSQADFGMRAGVGSEFGVADYLHRHFHWSAAPLCMLPWPSQLLQVHVLSVHVCSA